VAKPHGTLSPRLFLQKNDYHSQSRASGWTVWRETCSLLVQRRIWKKGLILGVTPPHGRTICNHIFIEGTCIELQKRMVVTFYFGGSHILQSVFHVGMLLSSSLTVLIGYVNWSIDELIAWSIVRLAVTGFLLSAVCTVLIGYVNCNNVLAVTLVVLSTAFIGVSSAAVLGVNQLDLSPKYAGLPLFNFLLLKVA